MADTGKCDIFGRQVDVGDPMSADGVRLLVGNIGEDMLVQQVSTQYQQNINRLWEVGSAKTYFVAGRTQGQMQMRRVIGPKQSQGFNNTFIQSYGNVCNKKALTLTGAVSCGNCESEPQKRSLISLSGVVITAVAYSIAAVDMIINEDLTLLFAKQNRNK
jgi:hypothetical protein